MKYQIETDAPVEDSAIATRITFISCNDDGSNKKRICIIHAGDHIKIFNLDNPMVVIPDSYYAVYIPFDIKEIEW